jgi:hypothetical protein
LVESFGVHPDFKVESADAVPSGPPPKDEEERQAA